MDFFAGIIDKIDVFAWGAPLIVLLLGTGVFMTIRQKFVQITGFGHGMALITGRYDHKGDEGDVSHFEALSTALSATVGVGNIAGVAFAIANGGPGALFWMWVTAALGMALKFTECTLAVKYREKMPDGSVRGGPMYYIKNGLGPKWAPLATFFAVAASLAAFGIGNMAQANSTADALYSLAKGGSVGVETVKVDFTFGVGFVLALLTAIVIIGGVKRIASVASKLVPFMSIFYVAGAMYVLISRYELIVPTFIAIFKGAFTPTAAVGGFAGSAVMMTMRNGVSRGIFSNESGLGSAPIAHAAARTNIPIREGLVALNEPFMDTLVICTMTGLVIVISGLWSAGAPGHQLTGAALTTAAFNFGMPWGGHYVVGIGLALFAYTTLVGWYYYGETAIIYLFGPKAANYYRWVYVALIPVGASTKIGIVWGISDIFNAMMAVPNLIAIVLLSGVVARERKKYYSEYLGRGKQ